VKTNTLTKKQNNKRLKVIKIYLYDSVIPLFLIKQKAVNSHLIEKKEKKNANTNNKFTKLFSANV
jgi:hypothetical protein